MTGDSCRWHEDPNGRCADPLAFPGVTEVPELCTRHLNALEPWIRLRVAARKADGKEWAAWAARRAAEADEDLKVLGIPGDRRLARPQPPERR
jgi:hypothetical protein